MQVSNVNHLPKLRKTLEALGKFRVLEGIGKGESEALWEFTYSRLHERETDALRSRAEMPITMEGWAAEYKLMTQRSLF